ncbi:hypothetical protein ACFE04_019064 [Oxalis oulophora]
MQVTAGQRLEAASGQREGHDFWAKGGARLGRGSRRLLGKGRGTASGKREGRGWAEARGGFWAKGGAQIGCNTESILKDRGDTRGRRRYSRTTARLGLTASVEEEDRGR